MAYCAFHKSTFPDMEQCPFCEWDEEEGKEEDEFESFDCHRDRNGYCGKAGSEECEFECPYNRLKGIKN